MHFGCVALVGDEKRGHLRPKSNEVGDRRAVRFGLEIANHCVVVRGEEWARLLE